LKQHSIKLATRFLSKSKECNLETGDANLSLPSDQTPASEEPAATTDYQEPVATTTLKVRRPKARVCPYRRSEKQLRRQIKEETFEDLRRLIRMAKIEAHTEVEEEMQKFEASAPEVDSTTLFDDH